ncbi:MAG: TIGR03086 family metal-binding protein [Acidimicrobiales bacterium]
MSENSRTFLKSVYGFDAAVRRVAADRWSSLSPCEGWQAKDVVAHTMEMNLRVAGFAAEAGITAEAKAMEADISDDPLAAWQSSLDALIIAVDSEGVLQAVATTPFGEMPVDKFLGFAWVDSLIHTWDLAKATGQAPVLDADLVDRAYHRLVQAGDSLRGPGAFGPAVEETSDMTMLEKFIAISGRNPRWSAPDS